MTIHELEGTIRRLTIPGKGILAADESQTTIAKRFDTIGLDCTAENRRNYRDLLLTTPGIEPFISGVILHEETLAQKTKSGLSFPDYLDNEGIVPGVKVDKGLVLLNNTENRTQGMDGLQERIQTCKNLGACFAKWRVVFIITSDLPSRVAKIVNSQSLALFAYICQIYGVVPIVEPEILMEGNHDLARCAEVSTNVLITLFDELRKHGVSLENIILKPSMVIAGNQYVPQPTIAEVAALTLKILRQTVPAAVPSINFLSGGQTPEAATAHLNTMNKLQPSRHPWRLSFSYGRALQEPALKTWNGKAHNVKAAQRAFYKRARLNSAACKGQYQSSMETEEKEAETNLA